MERPSYSARSFKRVPIDFTSASGLTFCCAKYSCRAVALSSVRKSNAFVSKLPRVRLLPSGPARRNAQVGPAGRRRRAVVAGRVASAFHAACFTSSHFRIAKKGHPLGCPFCYASARRGSNGRLLKKCSKIAYFKAFFICKTNIFSLFQTKILIIYYTLERSKMTCKNPMM